MPLVSVITNIGFDHTEFLGDTLLTIASEKAGIIKEGVPVVTGETKPEIVDFFREVVQQRNTTLQVVPQILTVKAGEGTLEGQSFLINDQSFFIPLLGSHQLSNVASAYAALIVLQEHGWEISAGQIRRGFRHTVWPGRMEVVSHSPLLIVDGAHNEM
jgi:dihydrofolate synthase/folylpolyglutamate synthase